MREGQQAGACARLHRIDHLQGLIAIGRALGVFHDHRGHQEDHFLALGHVGLATERAGNGVAQQRNLAIAGVGAVGEEAAEHDRLAALHADIRAQILIGLIRNAGVRALKLHRGVLGLDDAGRQFHAHHAIRTDEGTEGELDAGVDVLHFLRGARLRLRGGQVAKLLADVHLRLLAIQHRHGGARKHRGVAHLVEHLQEDGEIIGEHADLQRGVGAFDLGIERGIVRRSLAGIRLLRAVLERVEGIHRAAHHVAEVDAAHGGDVQTEGVVLGDIGHQDGGLHAHLLRLHVGLLQDLGGLVQNIGEVVHQHARGVCVGVAAAVGDGGFVAFLHLAQRHGGAALAQQGLCQRQRVVGREELQREDACLALHLGLVHRFLLGSRVHHHEGALALPHEAVHGEQRIQRLIDRHVVQAHADLGLHLLAGHDVHVALDAEQFKQLGDVDALGGQCHGAVVGHAHGGVGHG